MNTDIEVKLHLFHKVSYWEMVKYTVIEEWENISISVYSFFYQFVDLGYFVRYWKRILTLLSVGLYMYISPRFLSLDIKEKIVYEITIPFFKKDY